jgi:hypothetical protein
LLKPTSGIWPEGGWQGYGCRQGGGFCLGVFMVVFEYFDNFYKSKVWPEHEE